MKASSSSNVRGMIQTRKQKLKKSISVKKKSARSNSRHSRKNKNTKSKRYKKKSVNPRKSTKKSTQTVRVRSTRLKQINEETSLSQPSELERIESKLKVKSEVPKKYFLRQRTQRLSLERKHLEKIQNQRGDSKRNLRKRKSPDKDPESNVGSELARDEQMKSLRNSASQYFLKMFRSEDQKLIKETAKHAYQILHEPRGNNRKQSEQAEMKKNLLMSTFHIMSVGLKKDETKTLPPYEKYLMYNPFGLSKVDNLLEDFASNPSEGCLGQIEKLSNQFHHFYFFSFLEEKLNEMKRRNRKKKAKYPGPVMRKLEDFIHAKKQKAYSDLKKRIQCRLAEEGSLQSKVSLKRVKNGRGFGPKDAKLVAKSEMSLVEKSKRDSVSELNKMKNAKKILENQKGAQESTKNSRGNEPEEEERGQREDDETGGSGKREEKREEASKGEASEHEQKGIEHSEYINKRIRKVDSRKNVNDVKLPHIKTYIEIETDIKCPTKRILVNDLDQFTGKWSLTGDLSFSQMSKERTQNREGIPSPRQRPRAKRNKKFRLREIKKNREVAIINAEIDLVGARQSQGGFKSYGVKITKVIRRKKRKKRRLRTLGEQKKKNDILLYKRRCKELKQTRGLKFNLIEESSVKAIGKHEKPPRQAQSSPQKPVPSEAAQDKAPDKILQIKVDQIQSKSDKPERKRRSDEMQATSKQAKKRHPNDKAPEESSSQNKNKTQNKDPQLVVDELEPKLRTIAQKTETPLVIKNSPDFFSEIPETNGSQAAANNIGSDRTHNGTQKKQPNEMTQEDKEAEKLAKLNEEKLRAEKDKVVSDCLQFIRSQFESFFEPMEDSFLQAHMDMNRAEDDDNWEETCQEEKEYIIRNEDDDSLELRAGSKQSKRSPSNRVSSPKPQDPLNKYNQPTEQTGAETCGNRQSFFSNESPRPNALKCNFILNSSVGQLEACAEDAESMREDMEMQGKDVSLEGFYKGFDYLHYGNFQTMLKYMISVDSYLNHVAEVPQNWLMFYVRFEAVMMMFKLQEKHKLNTETVFLAVFFLDKAINFFFRKFHELKRFDFLEKIAEKGNDFLMHVLNMGRPPKRLNRQVSSNTSTRSRSKTRDCCSKSGD